MPDHFNTTTTAAGKPPTRPAALSSCGEALFNSAGDAQHRRLRLVDHHHRLDDRLTPHQAGRDRGHVPPLKRTPSLPARKLVGFAHVGCVQAPDGGRRVGGSPRNAVHHLNTLPVGPGQDPPGRLLAHPAQRLGDPLPPDDPAASRINGSAPGTGIFRRQRRAIPDPEHRSIAHTTRDPALGPAKLRAKVNPLGFQNQMSVNRETRALHNADYANYGEIAQCWRGGAPCRRGRSDPEALGRIRGFPCTTQPTARPGRVWRACSATSGRWISCVLLKDEKCSVYEDRPSACRKYDCRLMSLAGVVSTELVRVGYVPFGIYAKTKQEVDVQVALRMAAADVQAVGSGHGSPEMKAAMQNEANRASTERSADAVRDVVSGGGVSPEIVGQAATAFWPIYMNRAEKVREIFDANPALKGEMERYLRGQSKTTDLREKAA
jgi:hypothetical protein